MLMQTAEKQSIRESNEIVIKIIDSTYTNVDFKQVTDNKTHMNTE